MSNVGVICTTKHWEDYKHSWNIDDNTILLFDKEFGDLDLNGYNHQKYDKHEIISNFNLNISEPPDGHYFNGGNRTLNWFYPHLRMCNFFLLNSNYENYWFFDDDIKFTKGNITDFININTEDYDFIITYIFSKNDKYLKIDEQMSSFHTTESNWFNRFPGSGDIFENECDIYGSFFPVVMLNNRSLNKLVEATQLGQIGYSEGWVPTTLTSAGFKGKSLYNKDGSSDLFKDYEITHKNIKMDWDWL